VKQRVVQLLHVRGEVEVVLPELVELRLEGALGAQGLHAPALELVVLLRNAAEPPDDGLNVQRHSAERHSCGERVLSALLQA
jgi:hypothetical protein